MEKQNKKRSKHYLSENVIQEILVRLPINSIIRSKSVCKNWYCIIRSRFFIEFHRQFQLLNISRYSPSSYKPYFTAKFDLFSVEGRLPLTKGPRYSKIMQILGPLNNGISCLVIREFATAFKHSFQSYRCWKFVLCNRATRESNLLSHFPYRNVSHHSNILSLYYGFGNIHKISKVGCKNHQIAVDYKVILIALLESKAVIAYTYSLRRGSWKQVYDSKLARKYSTAVAGLINKHGSLQFPKIIQQLGLSAAFLNESCHWRARLLNPGNKNCILRFDMATEVFDLIAGPPENSLYVGSSGGVFVLNDRLAAIICIRGKIDVWEMMEYGLEESWTKIRSYVIPPQLGFDLTFVGMSFSSSTKDCHGCSAIERIYFEVQGRKGVFISCGSSDFKENCIFDDSVRHLKALGISGCIESLERVHLDEE